IRRALRRHDWSADWDRRWYTARSLKRTLRGGLDLLAPRLFGKNDVRSGNENPLGDPTSGGVGLKTASNAVHALANEACFSAVGQGYDVTKRCERCLVAR